jgi:hypothetical protein
MFTQMFIQRLACRIDLHVDQLYKAFLSW